MVYNYRRVAQMLVVVEIGIIAHHRCLNGTTKAIFIKQHIQVVDIVPYYVYVDYLSE